MDLLEIESYTKNNIKAQRHNLVIDVLRIQSSLIASRQTARSSEGFLISSFTIQELNQLLDRGILFVARLKGAIVGYLLIADIFEFSSLLDENGSHASGGRFSSMQKIDFSEYDYLYQIAVVRKMNGHGIGKALLTRAMREASKNLLTDVLIDPVSNDISLDFFKKNGFNDAGVLELGEYRDFGCLKSKVLIWKRSIHGETL